MSDKLNIDSNALANELLEQVKNLYAENIVLKAAINQLHAEKLESLNDDGSDGSV